ncbi:MAG TPA: LysM peptidoglycan-binding domain-containing protein [Burkholderiaceae bacterium]|nr:LysM peptidoglycan-binding domain-containing protein [Burkholderiaceae bacterium]
MLTPTLRAVSSCAFATLLAACAAGAFQGLGMSGLTPEQALALPERPALAGTPAQLQALKLAMSAADLLESGREDQARVELQKALALDRGNKLANNLMRQLTVDPIATLGRDSFVYVVRPGETLSNIAGRFLGDTYAFYLLARYNDIRVPRQLAGGQQIRIPGRTAPTETMATPADPARPPKSSDGNADTNVTTASPGLRALLIAEAAERAGNLDRALDEYRRAASLDQPAAAAKADDVRKRLIDRHTLAARTAFARQDLAGSIRAWDRVLDLDPSNGTAMLERQKAERLKQKVDKL